MKRTDIAEVGRASVDGSVGHPQELLMGIRQQKALIGYLHIGLRLAVSQGLLLAEQGIAERSFEVRRKIIFPDAQDASVQ